MKFNKKHSIVYRLKSCMPLFFLYIIIKNMIYGNDKN